MLNFDKERFVRIQRGAVDLAEPIGEAIDQLFKEDKLDNLFLIGSGGVALLLHPAAKMINEYCAFPVYTEIAAEFMAKPRKAFSDKSLVVIPSLSGTTKESLELAKFCREKGATVLSLVGTENTPLEALSDYSFYNGILDDVSSENYYIQGLLIATRILLNTKAITEEKYSFIINNLKLLPEQLVKVKEATEEKAARFAQKHKETGYHIITGAGNTWSEAYYYGMCILEEMQWIRTRPVHAADFFHGTLELLEPNVSIIVMKGEDESRALSDRVENFVVKYSDEVTIFDTREYELEGISDEVRPLVSPVVLATLLERISTHLEKERNHPLTTRRYYKKVAY
jgi:fructoselysine-6-phosphate deglycase